MNKLVTIDKLYKSINPTNLLKPIYFSGFIICNITLTYNHSLTRLKQYRNNEIKSYYINSEWTAVKYGATENFLETLFESVTWPLTIYLNVIPYIVLKLTK